MTEQIIDGVKRRILNPSEWQKVSADLLLREKELTKAHDKLASLRRNLPWTLVEKNYQFNAIKGSKSLSDLFAGRKQLIVYHHMLKPADKAPCPGCGFVGDQMPHLSHLNQRETTLVFVAKAPPAEIDQLKARMGWSMPFFSSTDSFSADYGVTGGFGLNVFYRDASQIYHTYFTTGRGVELLGTIWALLDLTPLGRGEQWEEAPPGTAQGPKYWIKLHDEY